MHSPEELSTRPRGLTEDERNEIVKRVVDASAKNTTQSEILGHILAWLKYPVIALTVILFLFVGEKSLGVQIDELSVFGVNVKAKKSIDDSRQILQDQAVRIQELEDRLAAMQTNEQGVVGTVAPAEPEVPPAQEVSDKVAALSQSVDPNREQLLVSSTTGFIWIGNYDRATQRWTTMKLLDDRGNPVTAAPEEIAEGSEFTVDGNLVIRQERPQNSPTYYRESPSAGVAPRGTKVITRSIPVAYQRSRALQVWVQIEVR